MNVRVLAVWGPVLFTDFSKPGAAVLQRLTDRRVTHYWDSEHRIARQLQALADPSQPRPECCVHRGDLWDLAALYPALPWAERLPRAVVFDGPVVNAAPELEAEILKITRAPPK